MKNKQFYIKSNGGAIKAKDLCLSSTHASHDDYYWFAELKTFLITLKGLLCCPINRLLAEYFDYACKHCSVTPIVIKGVKAAATYVGLVRFMK